MNDLVLFFLPQWSPFQPPLSLPSLAAWLRRAGYKIKCIDANILFYRWLLSNTCAARALELVESCDKTSKEKEAFRSILLSNVEFQRDLAALKSDFLRTPEAKFTLVSR